jgi:hypothetical protein
MENDMKKSESIAAPDPAAAPVSGPLDATVEAWFAKHFHGLGSMLDERLYNHVQAAKEDLKLQLRS